MLVHAWPQGWLVVSGAHPISRSPFGSEARTQAVGWGYYYPLKTGAGRLCGRAVSEWLGCVDETADRDQWAGFHSRQEGSVVGWGK